MSTCTITVKNQETGKVLRNATVHSVDEIRDFYYEACSAHLFDDYEDGPYFRGTKGHIVVKPIDSISDGLRTSIPLHESESRATCRCCDVDMTEPNRLKAIAYAFSQSIPCLETENQVIVTD